MGTVVMGKVESGVAKKGQNMLLMPNRTSVCIDQLWTDDYEVTIVGSGENVKIKLKVCIIWHITRIRLEKYINGFLLL